MAYYKTPIWVCDLYKIKINKNWYKKHYAKFIDWRKEVEIKSMIGWKKISALTYFYYLIKSKIWW